MIKKFKKQWKDFNKLTKGGVIFALIVLLIITVNYIYELKYKPEIYNKYKADILTQINSISKRNDEILNSNIKINSTIDSNFKGHFVKDFAVENDVLPFKNFGTINSKGGNCFGYSTFEMLMFENSINKYLPKNILLNKKLGEYHLSNHDVKKLYYGEYANKEYNLIKKPNKANHERSLELALKLKEDKEDNNTKIYNISQGLDDNELNSIIESISYLQQQKDSMLKKLGFSITESKPYYENLVWRLNKKNIKNKINPLEITNVIDNNKLVIISLSNKTFSGHAILAYGYQIVNETNIKIYVSDSNFPIIQDNSISLDEYKNNSYMLFTKDIDNNCWSYIYEPSYNGYKPYSEYNSFIPGSFLKLHYIA